MKLVTRRLAAVLCLLALAATPARAAEILVFAAASLTDALQAASHAYAAESGNRVIFSFGASSDLARQIRAGAPADVFFSADRAQMDGLVRAGLVAPARVRELLSNTLVVVVPVGSDTRIEKPADLLRLHRLALGDPEAVPAGVYARKWLESLGLWAAIRPHVVPTLNVRAALAAVASVNAEAAVVYRTDAAISERVRVAYQVSRDEGPRIVYPVAAVSGRPTARQFVEFLAGPAARAVFERYGFLVRP